MFKKIAAAAVLAGALAFSAAAPAVLSAGSTTDTAGIAEARSGNWPNPLSVKADKSGTNTGTTTYTINSGNWPNPL